MIVRRLWSVVIITGIGLASVFLLPYTSKSSPVGIAMRLPSVVGMWFGDDAEVTAHEIEVLAKDTEFARKMYTSPEGDQIYVSIVLSGEDMTTSIHRPERCLPAQGWTLIGSDRRRVSLGSGRGFETTCLRGTRVVQLQDSRSLSLHNLNYYWFVGFHHITSSHLSRTTMDLKDRVLHGFNQRWAYITVAANVREGLTPHGKNEQATAVMIEDFIKQLMPKLQSPDGKPLLVAN